MLMAVTKTFPKRSRIYPKRPERTENTVKDRMVKLTVFTDKMQNIQVEGPLTKISEIALITRRSEVQILSPPPVKSRVCRDASPFLLIRSHYAWAIASKAFFGKGCRRPSGSFFPKSSTNLLTLLFSKSEKLSCFSTQPSVFSSLLTCSVLTSLMR